MPLHPGSCKLGELLTPGALDDQDAALLASLATTGAVDHRGRAVPATALSSALRAMGHDVGPTTCKDHRARRCACHREDPTP